MPESAQSSYSSGLIARFFRSIFAVVAVIWLFLEDWLWDGLLAFMAWLGKLPFICWVDAVIQRLPPAVALMAFLFPVVVLLPVKLFAFWLIANHHPVMGAQLFIVAKVVGTALLARIFSLTRPALMTIGWFATFYNAFVVWKEKLFAYARSLHVYQQIQAIKIQARCKWREMRVWLGR